jgi:hypothetical protein
LTVKHTPLKVKKKKSAQALIPTTPNLTTQKQTTISAIPLPSKTRLRKNSVNKA